MYRFHRKIGIALFLFGMLSILVFAFQNNKKKPENTKKNTRYQNPTCPINSSSISIHRDSYQKHIASSKKLPNIAVAKNRKQQEQLIKKGNLVPLSNSSGYLVQKMDYGSPYLHPEMLTRIHELETRFLEKLEENHLSGIKFVITSAFRTTADQKRLQKINSAAWKGTSTHSYGTSVDIAQLKGNNCALAKPLFREILNEMQKEKKFYLIPESKTIHITFRK